MSSWAVWGLFCWFYSVSEILSLKKGFKTKNGSLPFLLWHLTFQSCTVHCLPKTFPKTPNFKGYMDDNPFCHQKNSQIESHCKNNQLGVDPSGVSPAAGKELKLNICRDSPYKLR